MSRATELAESLEANAEKMMDIGAGKAAAGLREAAALLRTQDEALTKIQADMEAMKALLDKMPLRWREE